MRYELVDKNKGGEIITSLKRELKQLQNNFKEKTYEHIKVKNVIEVYKEYDWAVKKSVDEWRLKIENLELFRRIDGVDIKVNGITYDTTINGIIKQHDNITFNLALFMLLDLPVKPFVYILDKLDFNEWLCDDKFQLGKGIIPPDFKIRNVFIKTNEYTLLKSYFANETYKNTNQFIKWAVGTACFIKEVTDEQSSINTINNKATQKKEERIKNIKSILLDKLSSHSHKAEPFTRRRLAQQHYFNGIPVGEEQLRKDITKIINSDWWKEQDQQNIQSKINLANNCFHFFG